MDNEKEMLLKLLVEKYNQEEDDCDEEEEALEVVPRRKR